MRLWHDRGPGVQLVFISPAGLECVELSWRTLIRGDDSMVVTFPVQGMNYLLGRKIRRGKRGMNPHVKG